MSTFELQSRGHSGGRMAEQAVEAIRGKAQLRSSRRLGFNEALTPGLACTGREMCSVKFL